MEKSLEEATAKTLKLDEKLNNQEALNIVKDEVIYSLEKKLDGFKNINLDKHRNMTSDLRTAQN